MTNPVPVMAAVLMGLGIGAGSFITPSSPMQSHDYLSGSVGWFDLNPSSHENESVDLRGEFISHYSLYSAGIVNIHPFVGVEGTTDGSIYGLGGVKVDLQYDNFYLTPSLGVGLYASGEGKNMGSPIEFRSGAEIGYQLPAGNRIGLSYTHISNAEISDTNPGAEILGVYYHYPIAW